MRIIKSRLRRQGNLNIFIFEYSLWGFLSGYVDFALKKLQQTTNTVYRGWPLNRYSIIAIMLHYISALKASLLERNIISSDIYCSWNIDIVIASDNYCLSYKGDITASDTATSKHCRTAVNTRMKAKKDAGTITKVYSCTFALVFEGPPHITMTFPGLFVVSFCSFHHALSECFQTRSFWNLTKKLHHSYCFPDKKLLS
jgi:hypothetical protein